mmetsp:Transcript_3353/g.7389  ORF Transcript_3353/g.7389 Transcript_3353/m.7389 type:complete len:222 (-) Transcript_3353:72-737(-)
MHAEKKKPKTPCGSNLVVTCLSQNPTLISSTNTHAVLLVLCCVSLLPPPSFSGSQNLHDFPTHSLVVARRNEVHRSERPAHRSVDHRRVVTLSGILLARDDAIHGDTGSAHTSKNLAHGLAILLHVVPKCQLGDDSRHRQRHEADPAKELLVVTIGLKRNIRVYRFLHLLPRRTSVREEVPHALGHGEHRATARDHESGGDLDSDVRRQLFLHIFQELHHG